MFLKKLTISNGEEIIREIPFHKGINLIVDESDTSNRQETGNNVGKTTVLRLVDYCLGSGGENIYKDPEFKDKSNTRIEEFLKGNNIIISLALVDDLDNGLSKEILIRRNFLKRSQKIQEINGEQYNNKEFPKKLKQLVFKSNNDKPTFKQIISKNIRDEKDRLVNTLKVLNSYTSIEEYEALYLFWLGIELDGNARKQKLVKDRAMEERILSRLKKVTSPSEVEQSLIVVNRNISELDEQKDCFEVSENYEVELEELNDTKKKINELSTEISNLEMRRELIKESNRELENERSNVDISLVKSLYEGAKIFIPNIQKTFDETVTFHNQMIANKSEYIRTEIPQIATSLKEKKSLLNEFISSSKKLANKLRETGVVEELQAIIIELNHAYEQKGILEERKRQFDNCLTKLSSIDEELAGINKGIISKDEQIEDGITKFNKFFSDISSRLYDEKFILSSDKHEKGYQLKISSIGGNLGTGKKKGQIAAFDLAYIQFAEQEDIECLHFVLQDQIENVHDNQITSLLTEVVSSVNCQYVLSVLRDKLPDDIDIEKYAAVSLSQTDKLFRVN